jgi:thiamine pyrophosphokinase
MEKEDAVIILGAGDYPRHEVPQHLLHNASRVVCCDGAAEEYIRREGKLPWRIVGDGDSLGKEFKERYKEIVRCFSEQENNDQTKATLYLSDHGVKEIVYLGATGRREDHTIGNVSLLVDYMNKGLQVRMYTDKGVFLPARDLFTANMLPDEVKNSQTISIFSFGARNLRSDGLQYPLHDLNSWWQGTLNRIIEKHFTIKAKGCFLLYLPYKA